MITALIAALACDPAGFARAFALFPQCWVYYYNFCHDIAERIVG